jgi:dTDP-glucose 4,6-dehydratase
VNLTNKTVLVTGACGFIFSNFVRRVTRDYPQTQWVGVDKLVKLTSWLNWFDASNYRCHIADIADAHTMRRIVEHHKPDLVIHGAAESFVDDSITDIQPFLRTNIIGTQNIVTACIDQGIPLLHISTDEVYGQKTDVYDEPWLERSPLRPRNPYSASKACAEHVVVAAHNTHGLQYQMTRSCNVYGPRQKDENLVPMIAKAILQEREITIHGHGEHFRQYVYVEDLSSALLRIIEVGHHNEIYNVGDNNLHSNLDMVRMIAHQMGIQPRVKHINDRKGHDFGYKVDFGKLRALGWIPTVAMADGLRSTLDFYTQKFEVAA